MELGHLQTVWPVNIHDFLLVSFQINKSMVKFWVCLNCCLVKMSDEPGTFRVCCSRITLHCGNMVGSTDLIFFNGHELIVAFDFSRNMLLITSLIFHVLLNSYMIHTYLSISSKICCPQRHTSEWAKHLEKFSIFWCHVYGSHLPFPIECGCTYIHYLRMSISQSRLLDIPLSG